jgi:hypothetical protein
VVGRCWAALLAAVQRQCAGRSPSRCARWKWLCKPAMEVLNRQPCAVLFRRLLSPQRVISHPARAAGQLLANSPAPCCGSEAAGPVSCCLLHAGQPRSLCEPPLPLGCGAGDPPTQPALASSAGPSAAHSPGAAHQGRTACSLAGWLAGWLCASGPAATRLGGQPVRWRGSSGESSCWRVGDERECT